MIIIPARRSDRETFLRMIEDTGRLDDVVEIVIDESELERAAVGLSRQEESNEEYWQLSEQLAMRCAKDVLDALELEAEHTMIAAKAGSGKTSQSLAVALKALGLSRLEETNE